MADTVLPRPDPASLEEFLRNQAKAVHAKDAPPADRKTWEQQRKTLRDKMFAAMGPFPEKPTPLDPKEMGVLKRDGYRIEKIVLQTRPDVWATTSLYVPEGIQGKAPAVLVVHGHWPGARRDPVVQARCLGLVKLGFVVLAIDAFGSGERFTKPASGTYHGALYGSALWPVGYTLLGMQVYDNRRAVDYLQSRPEVDGEKLGVTGASGGGNQTMYAGALDERFKAVVPVCSVGTYQAYLHAACCVCEVLPGALGFCEEGDVLGLVAPRALLVINATKDGFQFSVGEAEKSIARAKPIFKLMGAEEKVRHATFESPHAYNQAMRETMYGWMTFHLKGEGDGKPIPEPKHTVEKAEDLACYPDPNDRPKTFLFPPSFAAREAKLLLAKFTKPKPDHREAWEALAATMRVQLRKDVLGDFPKPGKDKPQPGKEETSEGVTTLPILFKPETDMPLPVLAKFTRKVRGRVPACVLLHLDGKAEGLKHPIADALLAANYAVYAPDLRGTGETKTNESPIGNAPDHNSTEHALWVGRPLLGQWVFDVQILLDWMAQQPGLNARKFSIIGIGQAGVVALCAAGILEDLVQSTAVLDVPVSYVTEEAYAAGTRMALLAPGILKVGDVPHLAALGAPRKLVVGGGVSPQGKAVKEKALAEAFAFTGEIYKTLKADGGLVVRDEMKPADVVAAL